jgi:signal transduction histidine kinase
VVTGCTIAMFVLLRKEFFARHSIHLTAAYMAIVGCGIALMIMFMGGFASPYYAGLNLVMITGGTLFVWPPGVVIATHGLVLLLFLVPNLIGVQTDQILPGIMSFFFMGTTAVIMMASQIFSYRSQREQVGGKIILEHTSANLERAHHQLQQLDKFKSQFFANITHELKTPLAMILSPLELMASGDMGRFSAEQSATIQTMQRNGMKLLKLIQDLLDLSKLEESRIRLRVADNDLVEYLRTLVQSVMTLTQRKHIEMTFESEVDQVVLLYDQERLERVFVNILSNAAKFTPEGGHIRVTLRNALDHVVVSVVDDGPGFPADKAEQVFERFYQVDMAGTRRYGGTGIGLALARELVLLHSGKIWADSEEGKGAAFHVQLFKGRDHFRPEALDRRAERRDTSKGQRAEDSGIADWSVQLAARSDYRLLDIAEVTERRVVERDMNEDSRPYTILVVEDNPDIIRLVHMSLRQNFKVLAAEDGLKGLELAQRLRPNLVITDYMMPGIDGMELARRLRADPSLKAAPIIMLTARGDVEDRVSGMESGVNLYLTKPFHPKELLQIVRTLLNIEGTHADMLMNQQADSLERVASGMAHEINNPLNYIKNAVAMVRTDMGKVFAVAKESCGRPMTPEEVRILEVAVTRSRRMVDTADAGVRRIAGTVELMRKYSREGYARRVESYDVFAAVQDVIDIVLPATGRDVRVETNLLGKGIVECVPEEFHRS